MSGGGSLGLGSSKSDSSSQSQSTSYGYSGSNSSDISRSIQEAISGGQSSTTQDIAFRDQFSQLFSGATGAANNALVMAPELTSVARQLFTGGGNFLQSLGGNDAGSEYLKGRLSGDNPELEASIAQLQEDTGRLFTEQLNPAIRSRAVAGGNLGGGRQGVAEGIAMEAAAREFTRGASALRSDDLARRDAVATTVAGNTLASASTGLGALPGLLDLVERGANSELGVYASLSGILGGPTVLSQSQSNDFSRSTAQSMAEAFARSFGEQSSQSTSSSRSRSRAWNFDASGYGGVGMGGGSGG